MTSYHRRDPLPGWMLLVFALGFAVVEVPLRIVEQWYSVPRFEVSTRLGSLALVMAAFTYAVIRILGYHPLYRPGYREWLEQTPWTSRTPLPLGPVSLVWKQDGMVLAFLALLSFFEPSLELSRLLLVFLIARISVLTLGFLVTGAVPYAYVAAVALGLMVRCNADRFAVLAIAIGATILCEKGLRKGFETFPWKVASTFPLSSLGSKTEAPGCGSAFDRLGPKPSEIVPIRWRFAIPIGLLAAWWLYSAAWLISGPADPWSLRFMFECGMFVPGLARLFVYVVDYRPPISILGRLRTFRWIIPRYDVVLIGPICSVLGARLCHALLGGWGVSPEISVPLSVGVAVTVALGAGPDLLKWQLTGQCRTTWVLESAATGSRADRR